MLKRRVFAQRVTYVLDNTVCMLLYVHSMHHLFTFLPAMVPRFYEIRNRPSSKDDGTWEEEKEEEIEV